MPCCIRFPVPALAELLAGEQRVAVVFADLTRPMPNRTLLPPLLNQAKDRSECRPSPKSEGRTWRLPATTAFRAMVSLPSVVTARNRPGIRSAEAGFGNPVHNVLWPGRAIGDPDAAGEAKLLPS